MKRVVVALLGMGLGWTASASPTLIPAPPQIAASGYLLMDADSGKVLIEYNADEQLPPASLTKMMTSYVIAYEMEQGNVSGEDLVTVSRNAWAQNPIFTGSSLMWIEVGTQVPLAELEKGIVISSGNDASVAAAEHVAGSESAFVDLMNQHARLLGLDNTHFVNSHGLPHPEQYSSARDMARIARASLRYPEHYALYAVKEFTYNGIRQTNRNRLLWRDPSVDGLKTGHTEEAGYCLVTSAKRDGMRLISVVMGAASEAMRERETQKLLAYGFRYFETHPIYQAGTELSQARVWGGEQDEVRLGVAEAVSLTIPRGQRNHIEAVMNINQVIKAPVAQGEVLGEMVVSLGDEELLRRPLVALDAVEPGSLFKRLWDALLLFVSGWFR